MIEKFLKELHRFLTEVEKFPVFFVPSPLWPAAVALEVQELVNELGLEARVIRADNNGYTLRIDGLGTFTEGFPLMIVEDEPADEPVLVLDEIVDHQPAPDTEPLISE